MSSIKRSPLENKLSALEGALLASCSGISADLQRILRAPWAVGFIAKSREIVRRKPLSGGAELSGRGTGDHEDAPERHRATFTFFIFILRTVTQNRSPVPSECANWKNNFRIARDSGAIAKITNLLSRAKPAQLQFPSPLPGRG